MFSLRKILCIKTKLKRRTLNVFRLATLHLNEFKSAPYLLKCCNLCYVPSQTRVGEENDPSRARQQRAARKK